MPSDERSESPPTEAAAWGGRFGWLAGGIVGFLSGFAVTFAIERTVLRRITTDAIGAAGKLSSVIVPALFMVGALSGHAFGQRGGATRYKWLGVAAGVLLSVTAWAVVVVLR